MHGVPVVSEAREEQAAGGKVAAACPCAPRRPQVSAVGMRQNGICRAGPEETPWPAGGSWGASPHALGPLMGRSTGLECFFQRAGAKAQPTGCRPTFVARGCCVTSLRHKEDTTCRCLVSNAFIHRLTHLSLLFPRPHHYLYYPPLHS
ncbi:hypothetical protein NDU88_007694 [Pleurodeles waltl]|uniref:Uncharacterized protein n=1 Tax=Pleurodeles waltl TaxID=8319 RepID=A0AAV7RVL2_PLEWA|nr:hypothetical protein NDU88_007694 [Pleurodeles waltl]